MPRCRRYADQAAGPRSSSGPLPRKSGGELVSVRTRNCRPCRDIKPVQDVLEQILGLGSEEALRCRSAVGPADQVVMDDRQHFQLARAELMQVMMAKRELAVTALHTRTGAALSHGVTC